MGTVNQIFSGIRSFFKRKDKPKENIKTINQVNEVPELNISRGWRKYHKRNRKVKPQSIGASVIKMAIRCNKTYIN